MTAIYSVLHMLVDGICALAMFGSFVSTGNSQNSFLIYNFCAFALQMPLGVLLDFMNLWYKEKQKTITYGFVLMGVVFTLLGTVTYPVILGIGNALFHVGGGVGIIGEDKARGFKGKGLGVFVAPGALGLYLGTMLAKKGNWNVGVWMAGCIAVILLVGAGILHRKQLWESELSEYRNKDWVAIQKSSIILAFSCFLVVILRSYIGMAVSVPWRQIPVLGLISVLAVVGGKAAGGFWAAKLGYEKTTIITLGIAALGYLGVQLPVLGLAAQFFFNMTMPMTLYLLIKALPKLPGFSFGLLTFGLFLGFLPVYFGWQTELSGQVLGGLGSLFSMVILLFGIWQGGKYGRVSD